MADQRRTITLSVKDDFSRQLSQFARMVAESEGELSDFQDTMSDGGFMRGVRNIRDMTMAFNGLVQAVGAVANQVDEFATLGTTARRNEFVLRKLTGTTKEYEASINAVTSALQGAVTEGEAAAIASQLLNLGLADSAESIEEFTKISTVIAAMSPTIRDADEAISQIGLTIANMSFMRLDQLGLSVADVKARMKELRAETKDMTKEAAFQQAVMEGLSEKADLFGDELLEIGGAQERMKARFRGFKEDIAVEVSEGLDIAFTSAEQLKFILDELSAREFVISIATEITGDAKKGEKFGDVAFLGPDLLSLVGAGLEVAGITTRPKAELEITTDFNLDARDQRLADRLSGEDTSVVRVPLEMETGMGAARPQSGGAVTRLPGRADKTEMVLPVRLEVDPQSKQSIMDEILGISKEFDPATSGFAQAREEAERLHSEMKGVAQQSRAVVGNIVEFENLADKFGIEAEAFDVSVFEAMKDALKEVEVEGDLAAEAIENFQLRTGLATGASEVFAGQMNVLASDLASGALSADEYVQAVMALSEMDFAQIDLVSRGLIDQGNVDMAQEFIDVLSAPGGLDEFEEGMQNVENLLTGLGFLPEEVEETPVDPIIKAIDEVIAQFDGLRDSIGPPMEEAMNLATGEVTRFKESATGDIDELKAAMKEFDGEFVTSVDGAASGVTEKIKTLSAEVVPPMEEAFNLASGEVESFQKSALKNIGLVQEALMALSGDFVIAVTTQFSSTPTDKFGGPVEEYQQGGFTGTGTQPFLALLHPNELVIPLDDLGAPGAAMQAGSNNTAPFETTVMIDGREVAQAVGEAARKEGSVF